MGLIRSTLASLTGQLTNSQVQKPLAQQTPATSGAYAYAAPQPQLAAPGATAGSLPQYAAPSGAFAAPSGAFAAPCGAFAAPSAAFAAPNVAFAEAHRLVSEGVVDLETAQALLNQPMGVMGAVRQAKGAATGQEDASMKGAGKALVTDPRLDAKKLTQKAFEKYEAAANLVDGLPKLVPVEVKPGRVTETADAVAGKAGAGASRAVVTGGLMALTLASSATASVGVIRGAVKRRRVKKAVGSVDAALQEMRRARDWLAASAQAYY